MKMQRYIGKILILCLLAGLVLQTQLLHGYALDLQASPIVPASSGPTLCFTEAPDPSEYPEVKIHFRIFNANFLPITDVTNQQIRISENDTPAVALSSNWQVDANRGGMDFYFVLDRSNRADPYAVKSILQEFMKYYQSNNDSVTLYTDTNNSMVQYYPSSNFKSLNEAVANFPEKSEDNMRTIHAALDSLSTQFVNSEFCTRPRVIVFVLGDGTFNQNRAGNFTEIAKTAHAKLALLHVGNARGGAMTDRNLYEGAIQGAGGIYKQVFTPSDDSRTVFEQFSPYRQVYNTAYQSTNGASGTHTLHAQYMGTNITTAGVNSYNINLQPPQVTLSAEQSVVVRNASERIEGGFLYDVDTENITVNVVWPDGYVRKLAGATLIVTGLSADEQRIPVSLVDTGSNTFKFPWSFAALKERGQHDVSLSLEVTDEFGLTAQTDSAIQVSILNEVSPSVYFKGMNWLLYLLAGLVAILLVAIILLWKRIGGLAVRGGQALSRVAGEIRKTLVGGGRRGKAMASIKILDGPQSMVGEELKIFTEKVSLGRDPKLADLTFYTPDANSSVSGLHAILERVSGSWRLVAVSQSKSETFVDGFAIPFNDPVFISNGQQVRLGYLAQQPVVFEFRADVASKTETGDPRKTDVGDKTTPVGVIKINKDQADKLKEDAAKSKESLFDDYID